MKEKYFTSLACKLNTMSEYEKSAKKALESKNYLSAVQLADTAFYIATRTNLWRELRKSFSASCVEICKTAIDSLPYGIHCVYPYSDSGYEFAAKLPGFNRIFLKESQVNEIYFVMESENIKLHEAAIVWEKDFVFKS